MAPREVVLGLDSFERRVSLYGVAFAFLTAGITAVNWARNQPTISKLTPSKSNTCLAGYKLVAKFCQKTTFTSTSLWEIKFFFVVVVALFVLLFTLTGKRAGVACFNIFLGLGLQSISGIAFFAIGAWLIFRAYRLQKYGDPTFSGSNRVAKEMSLAKREGRAPVLDAPKASKDSTSSVVGKPATPPSASKRYTPKKQQRRR
jgi:hypothetical protein